MVLKRTDQPTLQRLLEQRRNSFCMLCSQKDFKEAVPDSMFSCVLACGDDCGNKNEMCSVAVILISSPFCSKVAQERNKSICPEHIWSPFETRISQTALHGSAFQFCTQSKHVSLPHCLPVGNFSSCLINFLLKKFPQV